MPIFIYLWGKAAEDITVDSFVPFPSINQERTNQIHSADFAIAAQYFRDASGVTAPL